MKNQLIPLGAALTICLAFPVVAEGSFEMVNETGHTITGVYAGPSNESSWGPNVLNGRIASGEVVVITLDSAGYGCIWDLKYVFSDGEEYDEYEVDICEIDGEKYVIQ